MMGHHGEPIMVERSASPRGGDANPKAVPPRGSARQAAIQARSESGSPLPAGTVMSPDGKTIIRPAPKHPVQMLPPQRVVRVVPGGPGSPATGVNLLPRGSGAGQGRVGRWLERVGRKGKQYILKPAAAEKPARRKRKVPDAPAAEETQPRKLTVPRSPHLSSCSRPPPLPAEEPRQEAFRARPVPKSVYDAPPREDAQVRGEAKKAERAPAAAGQAERGGAARDEPAELELTEPEPFALECDLRHELHAARAAARQAAQENADKEQRQFRAVRRPSAAAPLRL